MHIYNKKNFISNAIKYIYQLFTQVFIPLSSESFAGISNLLGVPAGLWRQYWVGVGQELWSQTAEVSPPHLPQTLCPL